MRAFFEHDTGKDFVMVNALSLREPLVESTKKLKVYQRGFLGPLLKRAGHPVFFGKAAGRNIEQWGTNVDGMAPCGSNPLPVSA